MPCRTTVYKPLSRRVKPLDLGPCTWTDRPVLIDKSCTSGQVPACNNGTYSASTSSDPGPNRSYRHWSNDSVESTLNVRLRKKASDVKVSVPLFVKELPATSRMFLDTVKELVRFHKILKKMMRSGNFSADQLADWWLRVQYGFLPLLSDLKGAVELCGKTPQSLDYMVKFEDEAVDVADYPDFGFYYETELKIVAKAFCRVTLRDLDEHRLHAMGFDDPLSFIWEAIPFSFVVDWLFPVGDYLASFHALNGLNICGHMSVMRESPVHELTMTLPCGTVLKSGKGYQKSLYRHPLPLGNFNPSAAFRWEPSTSLTNVVSGLALLRQLRKS